MSAVDARLAGLAGEWRPRGAVGRRADLALVFLTLVFALPGCASAPPGPEIPYQREVQEIARGTVGSLVRFNNAPAMPVIGYGLVVGLKNTGGSDMPMNLRRRFLRDLFKAGIHDAERWLDSPTTAAVEVQGIVLPYHTRGSRFDVLVRAVAGTQTKSLEGGTLMKTTLAPVVRDVEEQPREASPVAEAFGPVVVRAAARSEREAALSDPRIGHIVGGGRFSGDRKTIVEMVQPDLRMCITVEQAINARFPRTAQAKSRRVYGREAFTPPEETREPGEPAPTAAAPPEPPPYETQYYLLLTVPPQYTGRWLHFTQVVASLYLDRREAAVQRRAEYLVEKMRDPAQRTPACYGLEAIGRPAIEPLGRLLTDTDPTVRLSAATVLLALGDARGTPILVSAARNPDDPNRLLAIAGLGHVPSPDALRTLQDLAGSPDLDTRLAAYEALRGLEDQSTVEHYDRAHRFGIDVVDCEGPPLVVAQAAGDPRLIFFGHAIRFKPPIFFDEGRYWAIAAEGDAELTVRPPKPDPAVPLLTREIKTSLDVVEYVILMDELGATYPEVLDRLRRADREGRLTAPVVLREPPGGAPVTERPSPGGEGAAGG